MAERRIAGAEIVDRDADAERLQPQQGLLHLHQIRHQHALGQLELEPLAGEAGVAQHLLHRLDEVARLELHARQVHRHRRTVEHAAGPALGTARRLVQRPAADRQHQAALLGDRDELVRQQQAAARMAPADQRLAADEGTVAGAQLRLEVQHELAARQALGQLALEHERGIRRAGRAGVEELHVGAPARLGQVHRRVGMLDQLARARAVLRVECDADRRRDRDRPPFGVERRLDRREQLARDVLHVAAVAGIGEQHQEFVAAEARHQIGGAQAGGDAQRHRLQQPVAGQVAERIVDALEVVEVDEQQRQRRAVLAAGVRQLLEVLDEGGAVRQAGQRVVVREMVDARARQLAVAHVAHDRHAQPLAVAQHRAHDELDRDAGAVPVHHGAVVARLLARGDHRSDLGHLLGRDELERPAAEHLLEPLADQLAQRRVGVGDEAVAMEHDAFGAGLHELGEALLGLAQRLLRKAELGDVGDQHEGRDRRAVLGQVRQQVDLDPARLAAGAMHLPLVGDGLALLQHAFDLRRDLRRRGLADDLGGGEAEDRALVAAEGARVLLVGEQAALALGLVVGDQHRHVVGQQAELLGLGARRQLGAPAGAHVVQHAHVVPGLGTPVRGAVEPARPALLRAQPQLQREVGALRELVQQHGTRCGLEQGLPAVAERRLRRHRNEPAEGVIDVQRPTLGREQQHDAGQRVPHRRVDGRIAHARHRATSGRRGGRLMGAALRRRTARPLRAPGTSPPRRAPCLADCAAGRRGDR